MKLKDLAVEHDYYCSESNYYSNDPGCKWLTWSEFLREMGNCDIDMNLVFRWDIYQDEETNDYSMYLFFMHQRKGIFAPHYISSVFEEDVESIIQYLKKHKEKIDSIWKPL